MKKGLFVMVLGCLLAVGCSDDSAKSNSSQNNSQSGDHKQQSDEEQCKSPKILCGEDCIDPAKLHLKDCKTCEDGYEPKDGDVLKGCKKTDASSQTCSVGVECDGDCVVLADRHWKACNVCENGYEDADGNPENGCERKQEKECENPYTVCDDDCIVLDELHWSDCHVCAADYEDADGDASNGCENPKSRCAEGLTPCGTDCLDLNALHKSTCDDCAAGFVDEDGNPENGCEKDAAACENENEVRCGESCVVLETNHWSDCNVCLEGYKDVDKKADNGCETAVLPDSECFVNEDCASLFQVRSAECQNQKCIITACNEGYANCDGDSVDGCESASNSDYYHCGAKGTCGDADAASDNFSGTACKLGEQCLNGACTPVPEIVGCADGTREGFLDLVRFNNIAACSGAWTIPGIHHDEGPACNRNSGNTSANPNGTNCNIEDICAEGWHVCLGRDDVRTRSESGCDGILDGVNQNEPFFFVTRTSSTGSLNCDPDTVGTPLNLNDIFGCGNLGTYAEGPDCPPLLLSGHNDCQSFLSDLNCGCSKSGSTVTCSNSQPCRSTRSDGVVVGHSLQYYSLLNGKSYPTAWQCETADGRGVTEAAEMIKTNAEQQGGAMCCKNHCSKDADCGAGLLCRYNVCVQCIQKPDKTYEGCPEGKTCNSSHQCI